MSLKRIEKEAEKRGIPKHHVHHWWNRLSDTEQSALEALTAGGILSIGEFLAGGSTKFVVFPMVFTGGYTGYLEIQKALNKWHQKREKKFRAELNREVTAASRKRMEKVI